MASPATAPRLILLLSSERSGSTLTRVILGENSRIVAPQELFLMRYPDYRAWRTQKSVAIESLVELFDLLDRPMDAAAIDAACDGRSIHEVYEWIFGQLAPGQILLDKTPAYANDGATLRRSLPLQPFYVWLIRHPLGVIESHVRLKLEKRHSADFGGLRRRVQDAVLGYVAQATEGMIPEARQREAKWVVQQTIIREFLASVPAERQYTIRFEELVSDPIATMQGLCTAIGVEFEDAMLAACGERRVMNTSLGDPNFHKHDRVEAKTASQWLDVYSEDVLTLETRRLMDAIGVYRAPVA
jgi:LPS sulfotransferase NodH